MKAYFFCLIVLVVLGWSYGESTDDGPVVIIIVGVEQQKKRSVDEIQIVDPKLPDGKEIISKLTQQAVGNGAVLRLSIGQFGGPCVQKDCFQFCHILKSGRGVCQNKNYCECFQS